jgi:hypothetical protein
MVKGNQPTLHQQLRCLPWGDIPAQDHTRDRRPGHPAHLADHIRGHWGIEICQADCAYGM